MKRLLPASFLILVFAFCVSAQQPIRLTTAEQSLIDEMNRVRTDPAAYAKWIEDNRRRLPYSPKNQKTIDEAIKVLRQTSALPALIAADGINKAARFLVNDQLPTGKFSHTATDGSTADKRLNRYGKFQGAYAENAIAIPGDAQTIVLAWIIDDLESGREHRKNLLNKKYNFTGAACGVYANTAKYPGYNLCVTPLAEKYK